MKQLIDEMTTYLNRENISRDRFGKMLGVSGTAVLTWESMRRQLPSSRHEKIAAIIGVDYPKMRAEYAEKLKNSLIKFREINNLNPHCAAKVVGIDSTTWTKWEYMVCIPSLPSLIALRDRCNIDFYGNLTSDKLIPETFLNPQRQGFVDRKPKFDKMPPWVNYSNEVYENKYYGTEPVLIGVNLDITA